MLDASFFIKEEESPAFVSWHQDSTYWGLSAPDVVTAWVAFTADDDDNGAMAGHPRQPPVDQIRTATPSTAQPADPRPGGRGRGRRERKRSLLELSPGEMSLHHVRLVHGSPPNTSDDRRIGFAIRYIPTSIRQLAGEDSATLVRGEDRTDISSRSRGRVRSRPGMMAFIGEITERNARILYRGTGVETFNDARALRG